MKNILLVLLILTGVCCGSRAVIAASSTQLFLPMTMNQGGTQIPTNTPVTTDIAALRTEAIRLINIERVNAGCPTATENATLNSAAQAWSDYMQANNIYEHSSTVDPMWYQNHGYTPGAAENVAGGTSPSDVVNRWMSDPPHKRIILLCNHASFGATYDIGIGAASSGNGNYRWTMALGENLP